MQREGETEPERQIDREKKKRDAVIYNEKLVRSTNGVTYYEKLVRSTNYNLRKVK